MSILVVEDNPLNRKLFGTILRADGFHPVLVEDAEQAIAWLARRNVPDAIVLDLQLPGMSGLELCHWIREAVPDVPILAVSAYARPADQGAALESGADAFMPKPVDTRRLGSVLHSLIRRRVA